MTYPSIQEVEAADYNQLLCWFHQLPSPGMTAFQLGAAEGTWRAAMKHECEIHRRIGERVWKEHGNTTGIDE